MLAAEVQGLPLADDSAEAVAVGDGPLFAAEAARIMAEGAVLVWVNTLGRGAPFFVPTEILIEAMTAAPESPEGRVPGHGRTFVPCMKRPGVVVQAVGSVAEAQRAVAAGVNVLVAARSFAEGPQRVLFSNRIRLLHRTFRGCPRSGVC